MKARYNLEEGKLRCRCIIRKWKFCPRIRDLAGGRVTPALLKCREDKEEELEKLLGGRCVWESAGNGEGSGRRIWEEVV